MKRAIVFGANGQDGLYLSRLLNEYHIQFIGVSRTGNYINGSVVDFNLVERIIKEIKPEFIFHFAANSTTRHSALFENHEAISTGTINILEAVRLNCPNTKVFLSGSAMQFKNEGLPLNEIAPFDPSSPYSVARIQSVYAGRYFRDKFGLKVYVGYFFNHDSSLRSESHINQKIARFVQGITKGSKELLEIGNIDVEKEFGFAGDAVNAIWRLLNQDLTFEAMIGTGNAYPIRTWLDICFGYYDLNWKDYVCIKDQFVPEYMRLVCDPSLIKNIGWEPKVDITSLAQKMLLNEL
jgi:GDPmannose 4,6-dehydratase